MMATLAQTTAASMGPAAIRPLTLLYLVISIQIVSSINTAMEWAIVLAQPQMAVPVQRAFHQTLTVSSMGLRFVSIQTMRAIVVLAATVVTTTTIAQQISVPLKTAPMYLRQQVPLAVMA
jgi:hypothetical protein